MMLMFTLVYIVTWDIYSGQKQRDLKGHIKGVLSLCYSHEHRFLMSAGSDRDVLVWNPMVKNRPVSNDSDLFLPISYISVERPS